MQTSEAGLNLIEKSEGLRTTVYKDVAGFPTIGYGHRLKPGESFLGGISEQTATAILIQDVKGAEEAVTRLIKVPLTQGQFDSLVDFVFNLGAERLASSTLLKCLNDNRPEAAKEQLLLWVNADGHPQAGLVIRREAEAALWGSSAVKDAATQPAAA